VAHCFVPVLRPSGLDTYLGRHVLMARSREHVYRDHSIPEIMCNRCHAVFSTHKALSDHSRSASRCELKELSHNSYARIDADQKKELRRPEKKSWPQDRRWKRVFAVIFPGEDIPSPCE